MHSTTHGTRPVGRSRSAAGVAVAVIVATGTLGCSGGPASPARRGDDRSSISTDGTRAPRQAGIAAATEEGTFAADTVATFSIAGFDPDTGELGVAVQSKFFGVGAVVPYAAAGVGAVATQASANTTYGPRGLELMRSGLGASEVVERLTGDDERRASRQLGIVDAAGVAATFTGDSCLAWAGGRTGEHYAAQGNILAGPEVVDAMAVAFEQTTGDLATRLTTALAAGQAAGGDARGRQSAALLVVRSGGGYGGLDDRYIELRVEDHPVPIRELQRLLDMKHGQLAAREATTLLGDGKAAEALVAAQRATALYPQDGGVWMTLAAAYVALDRDAEAAGAARTALIRDPWLKTAILSGLGRSSGQTIERLLRDEDFARFWETIPARR